MGAGRHQDLLDLLALDRKPFWHYRRYGVAALLAMGKKSEALKYAEASRGLNQPDSAIDQVCEEILISSGLHDESYRRYGLRAARDYLDSEPVFALGSAMAALRWLSEG